MENKIKKIESDGSVLMVRLGVNNVRAARKKPASSVKTAPDFQSEQQSASSEKQAGKERTARESAPRGRGAMPSNPGERRAKAPGAKVSEPKTTGVKPSGVRASDVRASETRTSGARISDTQTSNVRASDAGERGGKKASVSSVPDGDGAPAGKKKKSRAKRAAAIILAIIIGIPAVLAGVLGIMIAVGRSRLTPAIIDLRGVNVDSNRVVSYDEGKTIKYDGRTYVYNENIVPIAFMGVDTMELGTQQNYSGDAGQSDANMVLALDTASGSAAIIVIPRDSMVDMEIYDKNGEYAGIENMQLCLSYSFGDGKEKSCENTLSCIERLLCGIDITSYVSLDLSGIGRLNDAVGGVELDSLETIADFKEGEHLHLWGEQARAYVQRRDTTKFNSDSLRRARQMQYLKAYARKAYEAARSDFSVVSDLYSAASEYTCTNIDLSTVTYLASKILTNNNINFDNIYVLEGEAVMGERFMEVRLDESAVLETVLKVFYTEAE